MIDSPYDDAIAKRAVIAPSEETKPCLLYTSEFEEYLRDESRSVGSAQTISFPTCEDEIRSVLRELYPTGTPITVQGSRTGLAGGAVPAGGHVMNLSRAYSYLGLRRDDAGVFYLRVQPGVIPVSYTHLDVYKRQNEDCTSAVSPSTERSSSPPTCSAIDATRAAGTE